MKLKNKILISVGMAILGLFIAGIAYADNPNFWLLQSNYIKPISSSWGLQLPGIASQCLHTDGSGRISGTGSDCSIGGGGGGGSGGGWATSTTANGLIISNIQGGAVGINSNTPWSTLVVQGKSASTTPVFTVATSTGNPLFQVTSAGNVKIATTSASQLLLTDANNNVQSQALGGDATLNYTNGSLTLATVNSNVGTFGSSGQLIQTTANAKGLITAIANVIPSIATSTTGNSFYISTTTTNLLTLNIPVNLLNNVSTGTAGGGFNITTSTTGSTNALVINLPNADASHSGQLLSGDWSTFNNKQSTISVTAPITLTGASVGVVNQGTTAQVLHGNAAGNASFGSVVNADIANNTIDLTAKVTGILPVLNGGTGTTTIGDLTITSANLSFGTGDGKKVLTGTTTNITLTDNPTFTKVTYTNASGTNGTLSGNFYLTGIASGNCLQTGSGGVITSAGAACGSGGSGNSAFLFGNGEIHNATSTDSVDIGTSADTTAKLVIQGSGTKNLLSVNTSTGISVLRVNPNLTVGINTTTNTSVLYVQGTSTYPTLNPFTVASSNGASLLTIQSNGLSGFGSSTPNATVVVQGQAGQSQLLFSVASSTGDPALTVSGATPIATQLLSIASTTGISMFNFNTDSTFGINTTTLGIANLVVQGTSTQPRLPIALFASSTGAAYLTVLPNGIVGINSTSPITYGFVVATTTQFANLVTSGSSLTAYACFDANRQLVNDTAVCVAVSAARFKNKIQPLKAGLDVVMKLNSKSFYFKPGVGDWGKSLQYGPIADEVAGVDPNLVTFTAATSTFEGVTYPPHTIEGLAPDHAWYALFVNAFHDLQKEIDGIKNQLTYMLNLLLSQQNKIANLEKQTSVQQVEIDVLKMQIKSLK